MKAPSFWKRASFKRKLLLSFLFLATAPALILSLSLKGQMERTIDFWENPGVERCLHEALDFAATSLSERESELSDLLKGSLVPFADETIETLDRETTENVVLFSFNGNAPDLFALYTRKNQEDIPSLLYEFRAAGIPGELSLTPWGSEAGTPGLIAAHEHLHLADGSSLLGSAAVVPPPGYLEGIDSIREGFDYYSRLRVYERYAKAKIAIQIVVVLFVSALLACLAGRFLSRSLSNPVLALVEGTERIRKGELDTKIPRTSSDELGLLVDSFNRMTADLKSSREQLVRAERVATWAGAARRIAHEIKNSLTPITLSLHRLQRQATALDNHERRALEECLQPILEEVENLKTLAGEFSQFSRLPEPKMESFDMKDLLEKVCALYGEGTDVRFTIDVEAAAERTEGDRELLWRAFSNLVKNAVEAMEGEGGLALTAYGDTERVTVSFSDTGPGIPDEERGSVFTPYFTTREGGSGLGLALVERIVLDHGGSITVEPNAPRGTTFLITLPRYSH